VNDEPRGPGRALAEGQRCQVWIADVAGGTVELCHETAELLLEAPNWTRDGAALVLNGDGHLWRLDPASGALGRIPLEGLPPLNNDHVLHPDGTTVVMSAEDGHIHRAPLAGGPGVRLTHDPATRQYLHGISPDGTLLAYIETVRDDPTVPGVVAVAPASGGGTARRLETGPGHSDGAEFTPDGEWIWLNSEAFTDAPGHAQLARVRPDGTGWERLRDSDDVDWFPHASPDGRLASFLSFPRGTLGHPENLDVRIRAVATTDWHTPLIDIALFGGQGSLNVNSWAPDATRFAFVAYPTHDHGTPVVVTARKQHP
jgi:TolB protein